jgi:hypothetical protein
MKQPRFNRWARRGKKGSRCQTDKAAGQEQTSAQSTLRRMVSREALSFLGGVYLLGMNGITESRPLFLLLAQLVISTAHFVCAMPTRILKGRGESKSRFAVSTRTFSTGHDSAGRQTRCLITSRSFRRVWMTRPAGAAFAGKRLMRMTHGLLLPAQSNQEVNHG